MKNFYRLNNDIVIALNNKLSMNKLVRYSKNNDTESQLFIQNISNIEDFSDVTKRGNLDIEVINVDIMFRQSLILPNDSNAFKLSLLHNHNGSKLISKIGLMFNNIKPINPKTIDGSVFYGSVNIDIPSIFFKQDTSTLFSVGFENLTPKPQDIFDDYIGQNILNLTMFQPLSKLNLEIGNIENYVKRVDDYLEIGLKSLDESITVEQQIYNQIGGKDSIIDVKHTISYGFSDNIKTEFENIIIDKSVTISNNSNSLVPIEFIPIIKHKYDPNTINKIVFIFVESTIDVGGVKFVRITESKFDFSSLFKIRKDIVVNPIHINHKIENKQTIIETKEVIKPVIINQMMAYNYVDNQSNIIYNDGAVFVFTDFTDIKIPKHIMVIYNNKGVSIATIFGKLDSQNVLYFQPNNNEVNQINNDLKGGKILTYNIKVFDKLNDNTSIVRNGTISLT